MPIGFIPSIGSFDEVLRRVSPRGFCLAALAVALGLCVVLVDGPALLDPLRLLPGSAHSEVPNHAWTLAAATRSLPQTGPFQFWSADVNFPAGAGQHLMDPVNLPLFVAAFLAAGGPGGTMLGYHAVLLGNLVLAALAGWRAGCRFGGHPLGGLATAVCLLWSPSLLGLLGFGFTELMPVGWLLLHLEAMDRLLDGEKGRGRALWAGCSLAALFLAGGYLALAGGLCAGIFAAWRLTQRTTGLGPASWQLLLVAFIGLLALVPASLATLEDKGGVAIQAPLPVPVLALRPSDPARGRDLRELWPAPPTRPLPPGADPGRAAWPGALVTGLALLALVTRPRKTAPWLVLSLIILSLMPGPFPYVDGRLVTVGGRAIALPAWWLAWILPPTRLISDWGKLGLVFSAVIAVAAGIGAGHLAKRPDRIPLLVCMLLGLQAVDVLVVARFARLPHAFTALPPADLEAVLAGLPPGPILQLPMDNGRREASSVPAWSHSLWQLSHGRPIAENDLGPDAILDVADIGARLGQELAGGRGLPPVVLRPLGPLLRDLGFVGVILDLDRCSSQAGERARQLLGEPGGRRASLVWWDLAGEGQ